MKQRVKGAIACSKTVLFLKFFILHLKLPKITHSIIILLCCIIKTGFLPSCGCVNTFIWIHHMDANKIYGQKATSQKTAVVWPLTSYLTNHLSKMNMTCWALLRKQGWTHKQHSLMDSSPFTHQHWSTIKNLHQCCADTWWSLEERLMARENQETWRWYCLGISTLVRRNVV